MQLITIDLPDLYPIEPRAFTDECGLFFERWNYRTFESLYV